MDTFRAEDRRAVLARAAIGALVAGLCCMTPILLAAAGITSVAIADNWGNLLYGEYRWYFRLGALGLILFTLATYFRSRGICTLQQARRQRNRILNTTLLALLIFHALYVFWTYVVLHYLGIAAGLPWGQWDESWAIPVSVVLMGAAALAYWLLPKIGSGARAAEVSRFEESQTH
ncbi:MAG: hypothetical protein IT167_10140 [Bryobacterales bacterium]|nr:hypothetical protein [Bryobacterales bacterium]